MSTAVGVLILDEPQDLSATVRATLEHMPEFHTIAEADLARAGTDNAVALVFLDEIRLADGVARLVDLKERQPSLRTLVSFNALTADDLRALLVAGADALVARTKSPQELGTALLALAEGSDCLVPVEQPAAASEPGESLGLTPREAEVLRFLSSGFSNKEVARRLTLSVRTVETHRLNLRRKTQTGRLKDLVSLARQLGLAPVVESEPVRRTGEGRPAAARSARH
jgi:two-component system, LuxR family, secretion system response regulator SsrB